MSKLCIVTGGATGIGAGIVRRLYNDGYSVLFCDLDRENGQALVQKLSHKKNRAYFLVCDVKNPADIEQMIDFARELRIAVYALINNAGIFPRREFMKVPLEEWNEVIATNLTGPFLVAQRVVSLMLPQGDGVIVNIASGQSFRGDSLGVHYTSSKHAIRGLTKSLALALGRLGIRVNAIAPGATLTAQALQGRSRDELIARGRELPLGRIGQPEDVAGVVSFLLSDDARYVTGQTILVNGGADMP